MKLRLHHAIACSVLLSASALGCAAAVESEPPPMEDSSSAHPASEYLHPGVYVDETALRSKPIPGVATGGMPAKVLPGTLTAADAGH